MPIIGSGDLEIDPPCKAPSPNTWAAEWQDYGGTDRHADLRRTSRDVRIPSPQCRATPTWSSMASGSSSHWQARDVSRIVFALPTGHILVLLACSRASAAADRTYEKASRSEMLPSVESAVDPSRSAKRRRVTGRAALDFPFEHDGVEGGR